MSKVIITENQFNHLISEATNNEIILYHGSNAKIDMFVTDFIGGKDAVNHDGPGIYFTPDIEYASYFGKYIYTVKANVSRFLSDKNRKGINKNIVAKLIKMQSDWQMNAYDWDENTNANVGLRVSINAIFENNSAMDIITQVWIEYYRYNEKEYVNNASKLGFDGIISNNHYIVYNPNVITILKVQNTAELNESFSYNHK